jgi:hypothetical protein
VVPFGLTYEDGTVNGDVGAVVLVEYATEFADG